MVDEAPLETLEEPHWGMNMRICSMINSEEFNGTEIVRAIKNKISGKNVVSQRLSPDLLDACKMNCEMVVSEVASEKVLEEMVKLIEDSHPDPGSRERALQLIRAWEQSEELAFLPAFHQTYLEILRSGTDAETEREVLEIVFKHIRSKKDAQKIGGLKKWLAMRLKLTGFNASLCQTSWATSLGCPAGGYEYIDIVMETENGDTTRLIVDIDFKSQFELARPSATYKELTDALPSIFVGSEEKLNKIISVLCSAAKLSFREAGLHVPPWRTTSYMKSKWLSSASHKVAAMNTGFGNGGREAKPRGGAHGFSKWAPPMVNPKRRDLGGGGSATAAATATVTASALSSQFSNMGINCC